MLCPYCKKELKLQRWVETKWQDEDKYLSERFVYECEICNIIQSPKLVMLDCTETEQEKKIFRDLFFSTKQEAMNKCPADV